MEMMEKFSDNDNETAFNAIDAEDNNGTAQASESIMNIQNNQYSSSKKKEQQQHTQRQTPDDTIPIQNQQDGLRVTLGNYDSG